MQKFSFKTWGFDFFVTTMSLAFLIFILSVVPAKVCSRITTECYTLSLANDNAMLYPLILTILTFIINGVWALFQMKASCNWSAWEFSEMTTTDQTDRVVTEWYRLFIPRFPFSIGLGLMYFAAGIAAAVSSTGCEVCKHLTAPVGTWVAVSFFSFVAMSLYIAETVCIFKCREKFDGRSTGNQQPIPMPVLGGKDYMYE